MTDVTVTTDAPVRLDLASGQVPRPGFQGVDLFTGDHRVDLLAFPWPWADGTVDEVVCSHFVEHIPMGFVDADNVVHPLPGIGRKDLFLAFFDEVHRILKPGGKAEIVVPYLMSHRAFQDPTHRRFICEASFSYLMKPWRDANKLDHYNVQCDFIAEACIPITDPIEGTRIQEVQASRRQHYWNVVSDMIVVLRKPPM
jgi:predicted SAM-dependent methyltransferase